MTEVQLTNGVGFTVNIEPVAKGRPRFNMQRGIAYTPTKTQRYEAQVREAFRLQKPDWVPLRGAVRLHIEFVMPRPKGMYWKTKPMPSVPHDKRPDLDNLVKGVMDALNGTAWVDDAQVSTATYNKRVAAGDECAHIHVFFKEG